MMGIRDGLRSNPGPSSPGSNSIVVVRPAVLTLEAHLSGKPDHVLLGFYGRRSDNERAEPRSDKRDQA